MGPRKLPLVYLDACCFGVVAQKRGVADRLLSLHSLLSQFEYDRLAFIDSAWLRAELDEAMPASKRRKLIAPIPKRRVFVKWSRKLGREAREWVPRLGMDTDPSGVRDCRHLASALEGKADFLVTHDARFYEAMRQHIKVLRGLRPVWLMSWESHIYGGKGPICLRRRAGARNATLTLRTTLNHAVPGNRTSTISK